MKGQKTKRASAVSPSAGEKNASERAPFVAGGPKSREGDPKNGSHRVAGGFDAGNTAPSASITSPPSIDNIPSFLEPLPPSAADIPVSVDESSPADGEDLPMVSFLPKIGGSIPRNWDKVRLPALKNVGKDRDGKVVPHSRSEEVARVVAELSLAGTPDNTICAILNIRPGQLKQHYYNELTHTRTIADARVASTAYAMATSGDSEAMTKFVAKARMKWRDGDTPDGGNSLFSNIHIHVGE